MSIQSPEVNIKDLILDEPARKKEWVFDPLSDITAEEWIEIKKNFKISPDDTNLVDLEIAANLKLLNPSLLSEFYAQGDIYFDNIKQRIEKTSDTQLSFGLLLGWLQSAKILFPERFGEIEVRDEIISQMESQISNKLTKVSKGEEDWIEYSFLAAPFVLVFPEKRDQLEINNDLWEGLTEELSEAGKGIGLLARLAHLRILFPERELNYKLDRDNLNNLRHVRGSPIFDIDQEEQEAAWSEFMVNCGFLLIAQAESVYVTNKGLELKPKIKTSLDLGDSAPEIRKF